MMLGKTVSIASAIGAVASAVFAFQSRQVAEEAVQVASEVAASSAFMAATAARIDSCHSLAAHHNHWHVQGMADEEALREAALEEGKPPPLAVESEAAMKCRPPDAMEFCQTPDSISTNLHRMNQSVAMARELALCLTDHEGTGIETCVTEANATFRVMDDTGDNPSC